MDKAQGRGHRNPREGFVGEHSDTREVAALISRAEEPRISVDRTFDSGTSIPRAGRLRARWGSGTSGRAWNC